MKYEKNGYDSLILLFFVSIISNDTSLRYLNYSRHVLRCCVSIVEFYLKVGDFANICIMSVNAIFGNSRLHRLNFI